MCFSKSQDVLGPASGDPVCVFTATEAGDVMQFKIPVLERPVDSIRVQTQMAKLHLISKLTFSTKKIHFWVFGFHGRASILLSEDSHKS